jgi:hypothetical protein
LLRSTSKEISIEEVAKDPKKYDLILSGHHDHPACNGKYHPDGEKNGRPMWTKEAGIHLFWTTYSWDCYWGGGSPESSSDTPVPPLTGYDDSEIAIKYILKE